MSDADGSTGEEKGGLGEFVDALQLREPEATDDYLAALPNQFGEAEEEIVREMADVRVLAHPELFPVAHRRAVKGIEVLYRNGHRPAPIGRWGPLKPVVQGFQIFVTAFITRSHAHNVLQHVLELYTSRASQAPRGSEVYRTLLFARWNLDKMNERYRADPFSVPTFLVGGITFATLATAATEAFRTIVNNRALLIGFALFMIAILAAVGAGIWLSAGIARQRIARTTEMPIEALYAVVGSAGDPPRDHSWAFALGAIAILIVILLIIPGFLVGVLLA